MRGAVARARQLVDGDLAAAGLVHPDERHIDVQGAAADPNLARIQLPLGRSG